MTIEQSKNRTPDYDPRKNSSFINFLLRNGLDGGYQKDTLPCSEAEDFQFTNKIILGQFCLFPEKRRKVATLLSVIFALLLFGAILAAIFTSIPLFVTISIAVLSFLCSFLSGSVWFRSSELQHRYVIVELNCKSCDNNHKVLYDCITLQKRRRYGFYTRDICQTLQSSSKERSFAFIESSFEEMRNGLDANPTGYNCKDWADEFFMKIS